MRRSSVFGPLRRRAKAVDESGSLIAADGGGGGAVAVDRDGEALDRALTGYEKTFRELLLRLREVEEQWEELGRLIRRVPDIAAGCWGEAVADTVGTLGTSLPPGGPIEGMEQLVLMTNRIQRIRVLWKKRRECVQNRETFRGKLAEWQVKSEGDTKQRKMDEYRERIAISAQEVEDITAIIREQLLSFDNDHSQILANVLRGFAEANQRRTAKDPFGACVQQLTKLAASPPAKTLLQFGADPPMISPSRDSSQKTPPGTPPRGTSQGSLSVGKTSDKSPEKSTGKSPGKELEKSPGKGPDKSPGKSPGKSPAKESPPTKSSPPEVLNGKPAAVTKAQQ